MVGWFLFLSMLEVLMDTDSYSWTTNSKAVQKLVCQPGVCVCVCACVRVRACVCVHVCAILIWICTHTKQSPWFILRHTILQCSMHICSINYTGTQQRYFVVCLHTLSVRVCTHNSMCVLDANLHTTTVS